MAWSWSPAGSAAGRTGRSRARSSPRRGTTSSTARPSRSRRATRRSPRASCPTSSTARRRRSGRSRRSSTRRRPRGRPRRRRRSTIDRPAGSVTGRRTRAPSPRSKVTTAVAACVGSGLASADLRLEERAGRAFGQEPPDLAVRVRAGVLLLRVGLAVAVRIRRRIGDAEQRLPPIVHRVVVGVEDVGQIDHEHVVDAVRVAADQACAVPDTTASQRSLSLKSPPPGTNPRLVEVPKSKSWSSAPPSARSARSARRVAGSTASRAVRTTPASRRPSR